MLAQQLARAAGKVARTRVAGLALELMRTPEAAADTLAVGPAVVVLTLRAAAVADMPAAAVIAKLERGVS